MLVGEKGEGEAEAEAGGPVEAGKEVERGGEVAVAVGRRRGMLPSLAVLVSLMFSIVHRGQSLVCEYLVHSRLLGYVRHAVRFRCKYVGGCATCLVTGVVSMTGARCGSIKRDSWYGSQ